MRRLLSLLGDDGAHHVDVAGARPGVRGGATAKRDGVTCGAAVGQGHSVSRLARRATLMRVSRIFGTSVASVYPHYLSKVERKGRTQDELDEVICWLSGFDAAQLCAHLGSGTTFANFFADARLHPNAALITGMVCGVRVQEVDDPLMRRIRYLDKLVDELAKGRPMSKVLRA